MITRDYPPTIGGISTHTHALVERLRKDAEVELIVGGSDFKTVLAPLARGVRWSDYDVVHVQSAPYGAFVKHPHMVLTVHSPITEEGKYYGLGRKLKAPFARRLEGRSLSRAAAIISVSESTKSELVQRYGIAPEKISVIPNGVDVSAFGQREKLRSDPPHLLVCSRLDVRKNIDEALFALSKLGSTRFKLEVVGDGPERSRLEQLARKLVPTAEFLGGMERDKLYGIFASSHIFLSTSRSEGFGLSLLEAMAAGCAPLVSDIPVHRELITHLENGLLYTGGDELVRFLQMLLGDQNLVERLGRRAAETALRYSWDRVAEATLELYKRLLAAK